MAIDGVNDMAAAVVNAKAGRELRDLRAGKATEAAALLENVIIKGDLAVLQPEERVQYYRAVCDSVGINPLSRPFDYLVLNGKLVLYANRTAAEQLRSVRNISVTGIGKDFQEVNGETVYVVTAHVRDGNGREDEATGAVSIGANLKGEALANALMKAETKAKRRATLSISGLGMLDETEVETIPGARTVNLHEETGEVMRPRALPSNVDAATGEIVEPRVIGTHSNAKVVDAPQGPAPLTEAEQAAAEARDHGSYAAQTCAQASVKALAWFHATVREKWGLEHKQVCDLMGVTSLSKEQPDMTLGTVLDFIADAMEHKSDDRLAQAARKKLGQ